MATEQHFFQTDQLQRLLDNIHNSGYHCIGPQVRDGAIIYDSLSSINQLPLGISDSQAAGSYSLTTTTNKKYFDWANGPQAIKPLLFTPREKLWQSRQAENGTITFTGSEADIKPTVIFAARACDIAALKLQDQHFLQQKFVDPHYQARREKLIIIAVNCSSPADTCFCHSTGDGPFVKNGSDIVLTELDVGFLAQAETHDGEKLLKGIDLKYLTAAQSGDLKQIEKNAQTPVTFF